MSRFSNTSACAIVAALLVGGTLAGCSTDIYRDRRETVALGADDAVAANKVVHMIDPWPAASGNNNIRGEGHVVAAAIERYRTGKVIKPIGTGTSSTSYGAAAAPAAAATGAAANP